MAVAVQQTVSGSPSGMYSKLDRGDEAMTFQRYVPKDNTTFLFNKRRFEIARQRLHATRSLAYGWDTYGAEAPNEHSRSLAVWLLSMLEAASLPPSWLLPSAEGGIALSFVEGEHRAEIEIYNTGEIVAATYCRQNEPDVWALAATEATLKIAIEQIRVRLSE